MKVNHIVAWALVKNSLSPVESIKLQTVKVNSNHILGNFVACDSAYYDSWYKHVRCSNKQDISSILFPWFAFLVTWKYWIKVNFKEY